MLELCTIKYRHFMTEKSFVPDPAPFDLPLPVQEDGRLLTWSRCRPTCYTSNETRLGFGSGLKCKIYTTGLLLSTSGRAIKARVM